MIAALRAGDIKPILFGTDCKAARVFISLDGITREVERVTAVGAHLEAGPVQPVSYVFEIEIAGECVPAIRETVVF